MNRSRFRKIVAMIENDPKSWNQTDWHCGTTHCIAGFCTLAAAGEKLDKPYDWDKKIAYNDWWTRTKVGRWLVKHGYGRYEGEIVGQKYLGLNEREAEELFYGMDWTLEDLKYMAKTGKIGKAPNPQPA